MPSPVLPGPTTRSVEHAITVAAPPTAVYDLIQDVVAWPRHFAPTVHAERVEGDDREEVIRIWATANDSVKTWTSRRWLDAVGLRVQFRQEVSQPPVAEMGGIWQLEPLSDGGTRVRLAHHFRAVDDDPFGIRWIAEAIEVNSTRELAGIKEALEGDADEGLSFSFDDSVHVEATAVDLYDFLNAADRWPERLPHVARLDLTEEISGLQRMEMDTRTADGSVHTTSSVRVCFPHHRIVYKQTTPPALLTMHTGEWLVTPAVHGVTVTSRHNVRIKPDAVEQVLGAGATVADARAFLRRALGTNSRTTLEHAAAFAERRA